MSWKLTLGTFDIKTTGVSQGSLTVRLSLYRSSDWRVSILVLVADHGWNVFIHLTTHTHTHTCNHQALGRFINSETVILQKP